MKSPYPRPEGDERRVVQELRASAGSSYHAATMVAMIGLMFVVLAVGAAEKSPLWWGAFAFAIGVPWRHLAKSKLLELKGLTWKDCPARARFGFFLFWYDGAPDRYPYASTSLDLPDR